MKIALLVLLLLFAASATVMHLRGKVRLRLSRQAFDHSTFMAPINVFMLAFSRVPGAPKRYVQDLMRERAPDLAELLKDGGTHVYVCGLKSMEEGVVLTLRDIAEDAGLGWEALGAALKREGRLHLETY